VTTRSYHQKARAEGVERTRGAILDAVDVIFLAAPGKPFSLEEVAERAGTTVQTILRHFGSKAALLEAASLRGLAAVRSERDAVRTGDLKAVADYLGRHYEHEGQMVLGFLALENQSPELAAITQRGREFHRLWAERVFAPFLEGMPSRQRRRRIAAVAAVTDVLTWKVLRREQGLTPAEYVETVHELLEALK
jgi:AcrR family transcriptional regulator